MNPIQKGKRLRRDDEHAKKVVINPLISDFRLRKASCISDIGLTFRK